MGSDENLYAKYCRFDSVEYVSDTTIYIEIDSGTLEYNGAYYTDTDSARSESTFTASTSYEITNTCTYPVLTEAACLAAASVLTPGNTMYTINRNWWGRCVYDDGYIYFNIAEDLVQNVNTPDTNVCYISPPATHTCVDKEAFGRRDGFLNERVPYEAGSFSECVVECALQGFAHTLYTTDERLEGTYYDQECNFGLGCNVVQTASSEHKCWCHQHNTQQACEDAGNDWIAIDVDYSAIPESDLNPPGRGLRVFNDINGNPLISLTWLTLDVPKLLRVTDVVCYA